MWQIRAVKKAGWANVSRYFWPAVVVTFLSGMFSGSFNYSLGGSLADQELPYSVYVTILGVMLTLFLVFILLKIFVGNPLEVGGYRYFMESREKGESAGIGRVFWAFGCGSYLNVARIMFLRDLYTFLWGLLLIIPGIIKSYEYIMIPFILSENPEADAKDAFALTKDMMSDGKLQYFCLHLSFIGWYLLTALITFFLPSGISELLFAGICTLLISAYVNASTAEVYAILRKSVGGYPFNGYGGEPAGDAGMSADGGMSTDDGMSADDGMPGQDASAPVIDMKRDDDNDDDDDDRDFFR